MDGRKETRSEAIKFNTKKLWQKHLLISSGWISFKSVNPKRVCNCYEKKGRKRKVSVWFLWLTANNNELKSLLKKHIYVITSFIHEVIQYAPSNMLYEKKLPYKHYIWTWLFFLHELNQYAHSDSLCEKKLSHNDYIWMFFLYELIQYVLSNLLYEKKLSHKCYIWQASFLHGLF